VHRSILKSNIKVSQTTESIIKDRQSSIVARILVTSLFFLWGFALNLNPILIPHLKRACQLNDLQSAFIDSASYIAYFLVAIPAGLLMRKIGYKGGITIGLVLFSVGAFLFLPAAETRIYGFFLLALFVIACGLTFLETAANPYITSLGDPAGATRRLNLAQSFNGLSATLAPLVGGYFILSANAKVTIGEYAGSVQQFENYLQAEAALVKTPFLIIGIVVLLVALLMWKTKLPEIAEHNAAKGSNGSLFGEVNSCVVLSLNFFT
jgi:FHS family L-fucose permease-like MFS transporter